MELGRAAITDDTVTGLYSRKSNTRVHIRQMFEVQTLTWEGGDVIFEEALSFSSLGHEPCERSLHVSPLTRRLLSHHLVIRHRLSERL